MNDLDEQLALVPWMRDNLGIRLFGDPLLYKKCLLVRKSDFGSKRLKAEADLLLKTLAEYRARTTFGRGLAANQIGLLSRMFVVWASNEAPKIYINPRVFSKNGSCYYAESCLSGGGLLTGDVLRPLNITVQYQNIEGSLNVEKLDDRHTRVFLHELDHLNGRICVDQYIPGTTSFVFDSKALVAQKIRPI